MTFYGFDGPCLHCPFAYAADFTFSAIRSMYSRSLVQRSAYPNAIAGIHWSKCASVPNPWKGWSRWNGRKKIGNSKAVFPEVGTISLTFDYSTQNGAGLTSMSKWENRSTQPIPFEDLGRNAGGDPESITSRLFRGLVFKIVAKGRCGRVEVSLLGREMFCFKNESSTSKVFPKSNIKWEERGESSTVEPDEKARNLRHWGWPAAGYFGHSIRKLGAPGISVKK